MNARKLIATLINIANSLIIRSRVASRKVMWHELHGWLFVLGMFLGVSLTLLSFILAVGSYRSEITVAEMVSEELQRPSWPLLLQAPIRQEVVVALGRMNERDLIQTYVDVHTAFEESLGGSNLSTARSLIDYAFLTDRELAIRGLALPDGLPSPAEMLRLFELLL